MTLTVPEAARRVGKNPETIRRWIWQGRLRSTKIGNQHFVEPDDLEAAVARESPPSREPSWQRFFQHSAALQRSMRDRGVEPFSRRRRDPRGTRVPTVTGLVVVDASLVVDAALGRGEAASALAAAGRTGRRCVSPALLWSEVTSALHAALHRGVLVATDAASALAAVDDMDVQRVDKVGLHRRAWEIADRMGWVRTYDAEYCALAELEGCELLTSDARLRRAAEGRLPYVLDAAEAAARL